MRIKKDNIVMVKHFAGDNHNPDSRFAVMLKEGNERELREYRHLPAIAKGFISERVPEVWYADTEFITFVWKRG